MIDTVALREKVLDLAIRGKLVPQDPSDEPASVLLERIRAQKQQMVKEGTLKAKDIKDDSIIFVGEDNLHYEKFSDGTIDCIEDEVPFSLPKGWEWSRVKIFCVLNPKNNMSDNEPASFIPMPLIKEGYSNVHSYEERTWALIKNGFTHFANNDIGIAKITPCFENRKSVVFRNLTNGAGSGTTELFIVRSISDQILSDYLLWNFKTQRFIDGGVQTYTGDVGQQRVRRDYLANYLIAIPPINEQIRILESIDSCFKLVDTIDDSRCEMSDLISKAKSKILDLAIRGKLVPQNPEDEPASALLERIRAEKEELIRQGKIKRDKKESIIFKGEDNSYYEKMGNKLTCIDSEIPYELPKGWEWSRLGTVGEWGAGGTPNRSNAKYFNGNIPWLKTGDLNDGYITNIPESITELALQETSVHINPTGAVLIAMYGATIGKLGILTFPATTNQACCACKAFQGIDNEYLFYYLLSQRDYFINRGVGGAQSNISKEKIVATLIPIPPYNEQKRIIDSIKTLIALISSIEKSLT